MKKVLVIFQAVRQETESLALAFGLGAVRGGADIRLRQLKSASQTELQHAGYGALRAEDLTWAEGIGIFLESLSLGGFDMIRSAAGKMNVSSEHADKRLFLHLLEENDAMHDQAKSFCKELNLSQSIDISHGILTAEEMAEAARVAVATES